jgi:C-terminal processing protease CtpA/Prc
MPVRPAGGSIDEASKDMHRPFSKDYAPSDNSGLATAEISIAMILDGIGVHASWAETGWRVDSLISNSVGARTGIRPGDIIESLDGQMLSEKTSFKGAFSGKSIRVRRDGALIDLAFKP